MGSTDQADARLSRTDIVLLGLTVAACVVTAVITSAKKYLWYDELFGWTLANDPSLGHALRALADGADSGPPLMVTVSWMATHLIGRSELAFRALSCLCFVLTLIVLWMTLRRAYPVRAVALGVATAVLGSASATYQFSEGRYYGLLSLAVALGVACVIASDPVDQPELAPRLRIGTAVTHTAIVFAHTIGFLYSAALLVATVVRDAMRGRVRPTRYVPILVAWVAFLPWIPAVRRQGQLFAPHSWMAPPTLADLGHTYLFGITALPIVLLLVVALGAIARPPARVDLESADRSLLVVAYALLGVPFIMFIGSRVVLSMFVPRYFVPAVMGWAVIIAHLASRAERATDRRMQTVLSGAWALAFAGLVLSPVIAAIRMVRHERPGLTADGIAPSDVPVVVEEPVDFLPYAHYATRPAGYYFVLDWAAVTDPRARLWAAVGYKAMDAWRRNNMLASRIVQGDAFLRDHPRFIVIVDDQYFGWYDHAIRDNPAYTSRELSAHVPVIGGEARAVLVDHVAP